MKLMWLRSGGFAGAIALLATTALAQGTAGQTGAGQTMGQGGAGTTTRSGSGQTNGRSSASHDDQQGDSKSRKYVEHMLIANMAEIQLGQMAAERASSSDVKSFAQQMVTDHTRANQELMPVAQQLGVQQPTQLDGKHQKIADKLSKAQGADFDRQFMKAMVSAHQDVVNQTKKIAGNNNSATGSSRGTDTGGTIGATGTSGTVGSSGAAGTSGSSGASGTSAGSGSSGGSATSGGSGTSGSAGTSGSTSATSGSTSGTGSGTSMSGTSMSGSAAGGAQSVAEYAAMTLPIVQQHLQHAQMLEESAGKNDKK
jgi:putative membrane protein